MPVCLRLAASVSVVVAGVAAAPLPARAGDAVQLEPAQDVTLIESSFAAPRGNGQSDLYSGKTRGMAQNVLLRAALQFDIAGSIPAGSTITSVTLQMSVYASAGGDRTHTLHRLTADWSEGPSETFAGNGVPAAEHDVTWFHRDYPSVLWSSPGGDFDANPSASQVVPGITPSVPAWSSAGMVADVQGWLDNPATNFGWLLKGDEGVVQTAKKFGSGEAVVAVERPRLMIAFTPPCPADCAQPPDGVVNVGDLLALIADWGAAGGNGPCDIAPPGGNGVVNVADLLELIANWGPC